MVCKADKLAAFSCADSPTKDGYCKSHWHFLFKGMTNRQRMMEKKHLREIITEKERGSVQAG